MTLVGTIIQFAPIDFCIWVSPFLVQDSPTEGTPHRCNFLSCTGLFVLRWRVSVRQKRLDGVHARFHAPRLRRCQYHSRCTLQCTALKDPQLQHWGALDCIFKVLKRILMSSPIQKRGPSLSACIAERRYGQSPG
jgi:hypothetical protein